MTDGSSNPSPGTSPLRESLDRQITELSERHRIGSDRYCGFSPEEMSRAVVACHSGPRRAGEPAGYWPAGSEETRMDWLRAEYGPTADLERVRVAVQFFDRRVAETLAIDWDLPHDEFDQAVVAALARHYPELSDDARGVIAGSFSYSHAK